MELKYEYDDPAPCGTCPKKEICTSMSCPLWRAWFSVRWRSTQELYGITESAAGPGDGGMSAFSRRLCHLRVMAGLTQTELSRLCGLSHAMIQAYETGKSHPMTETFSVIAKVLGVPEAELTLEARP